MPARKDRCSKWGDPMSYSDVHIAKMALRKPNKFICIRCFEQAITRSAIKHKEGCPCQKEDHV